MAQSIAELKRQRAAIKRERSALIADMKALLRKAADGDSSTLPDEDRARFDEHEKAIAEHDAKIQEHDGRINLLETIQELEAKEADEAEDADEERSYSAPVAKAHGISPLIRHKRPSHEPKGTRFARFVIGAGVAKAAGSVNAGARYVQDNYGDDEVSKALNSMTQPAGGALVPQDFRNEMIELLYAETVVRGSGAGVIPMPMGNITIPRIRAGASAFWLSTELDPITPSQPEFDDIQMSAKKLTAMVPTSADLVRRAPQSVEAIVRSDMIRQLALAEDLAFLTSDGSNNRPKGMLAQSANALLNVAVPTDGISLAVVNNALQALELTLRGANVPMNRARWFFHPAVRSFLSTITDQVGRLFFQEELARGVLNGIPFSMTNQLATNLGTDTNQQYIILAAMDQCLIGDTLDMVADSSSEASYTAGGNTFSAYQRDMILFRCISEMDFAVRHPQAIAAASVAGWLPSGYTGAAGQAYSTQTAVHAPSAAASASGNTTTPTSTFGTLP